MSAWRRSLSAMCRKAAARRGSRSIEARASYRTIASCSSLRLSRLWAMFTRPAYRRPAPGEAGQSGCHRRAAWRPTLGSQRSPMTDLPPLRYLHERRRDRRDAAAPERLALAETVLRGLAGDAELPPKIGVHPRPAGSFGHAMPAYLPGGDASGVRRPRGHEVGHRGQPEQRARHPGHPRHAAAQRPGHAVSRSRSSTPGRSPPSGRRRRRASRSGRGRRHASTAGRRGPRSSAPGSRAGATCR